MLSGPLGIGLLCGGRSSRFGSNKALAGLEGVPLIQKIVEQLMPLSYPIFLIAHPSETYPFLKLPVVLDSRPFRGPLAALVNAFEKTAYEKILLVACDIPSLNLKLMRELLRKGHPSDACAVRDEAGAQYLLARYSRRLLHSLKDFTRRGGNSFKDYFSNHPESIVFLDSEERVFNLNTRKEWEEFQCSLI